jgi:hypothetical protein
MMLINFEIKNQCQNDRKITDEQNKNYKIRQFVVPKYDE